jgi:predicted AAA+ superfamily ATPase
MTLKPWREIITPHEDVLEGSFREASFAADLTQVVSGVAPAEYQDPEKFFERTVITEGMSLLLQSVLKRLSGKGGDPVVQLQTAFGGGKTHTMLAVLHAASGNVPAKKMLGLPELLDKAKVDELVKARVAVLDGNALSPSHAREHGKLKANTLWGELAWQVGRDDGYELVAASDHDGTSPGKEVLARLFERFGPVIVLMDETVAYLRQFEPGKSYLAGTFNSNLSFLQALTEAASRVPNAMVLASLPESAMEIGDARAEEVLATLQKTFGRIEAVWKPVGTDEAFEIVRRRLFGPVRNEAARDETCGAFVDLYAQDPDKFPAEVREGAYRRRLTASYPIHPEVFDRLYQDWSTLPKFQRTRGVLRLMARLVHSLWRSDNRDPLILPGSIPLDDLPVRNELVKYLPAGWDAIVDKDIDGANAQPRQIDASTPALGGIHACRRAARTIFLGSAPSVASQTVRGIGVERVRLGCAEPGQSAGKYDDAIKRLIDRLHYMYSGNDRFWFDLRPNLRREMEDRVRRFDDRIDLHPELEKRLQTLVKAKSFPAIHIFRESKDIPDKVDLRLVVLDPNQGHKRKDLHSPAVKAAQAILTKHGDKPREYQNRVLFLAPDLNSVPTLRDQVRRFLAWQSIVDDADQLNLDKHHEKEAKKSRDEADARVTASVKETYRLLLVPVQDPDADGGLTTVQWEDESLALAGSSYEKAIERATTDQVWIISSWGPTHLATLLTKWFWKPETPAVKAEKVWLDTCRYLYMPRLLDLDAFTKTVESGTQSEEFFGLASGERSGGGYAGLLFGSAGSVCIDDVALLVRPDAALAARQVAASRGPGAGSLTVDGGSAGYTAGDGGSGAIPPASGPKGRRVVSGVGPPTQTKAHRFHGTVDIDAKDPIGAFTEVVENVIEHFTVLYGTKVRITMDIEAQSDAGFETKTVRVVRENARTLKFGTAEFEEE